jgi:hypothetical protein
MSDGTWTTTNGGAKVTISASGVGALIAVGYALTHPHQASEAASGAVTILAITVGALVAVAALAVFLKLRRRGRTVEVAESRQPVSLLRANPRASELPPRERPAIAPVVINNFTVDPERIADLFATARQQPAPVYVQSEQQQEIPR